MKGSITITPFARSQLTTAQCMMLVILAMLPGAGYGLYSYGAHALVLILVSAASAVVYEAAFELLTGRKLTISDCSAAVTGMCLAMLLPPSAPWWFPLLGNAVAIIAAKQLFGGIGRNLFNPAACGKLLLVLVFHRTMTNFSGGGYGSDTPLMVLSKGGTIDLSQMLLGNVPGSIGTASAVCVLIGAAILFLAGIIRLDIPLAAMISFSVIYVLFGGHGLSGYYLAAQIAGGSFLFTVFFMANDFATTPVGKQARIVYGILLGVLIGLFRIAGSRENAALYALFLTNLSARFLDARLAQRPFGTQTARRRTRISGARTPEEQEKKRRQKEEEERALAESFQNFESTMVPKNAQNSETAGTINQESMDLYNNRSAVLGNPYVQPSPYLDPNMGTGPMPGLDPNMGTGPMPYLDPNMGTGPIPNPYEQAPQQPYPEPQQQPVPPQPQYQDPGATQQIPPLDPYLQQAQQPMPQPYPEQQVPLQQTYPNSYLDPNMTGPIPPVDPYQQQVPPQQVPYGYGQPQYQQPYGTPYPDPNAGYPQQMPYPQGQPYYDPAQGQAPYGYAPQYGTMPQGQAPQMPPLQTQDMSAGKTAQQLAEEEEARRQAAEEEEQRLEEERRARLERIHKSPRAVEARLRRNRRKRLEESGTLEERQRARQEASREMRNAVRWDEEYEQGNVSDSLQYIDLTQDDPDNLDFDAQQEQASREDREESSLAGLMTENIPVEEIERQIVQNQNEHHGRPTEEDPFGTPAERPEDKQS